MSVDLLFHMADTAALKAVQDARTTKYYQQLCSVVKLIEHPGFKRKKKVTQCDIILEHMANTGSISQREAIMDYSIQSLTKRISELRGMGFEIETEFKVHPTTGQRYARYYLRG